MELKNKGTFSVILDKKIGKYIIVYIEKGIIISLDDEKYTFTSYKVAEKYLNDNLLELDAVVFELKEAERKRIEEEKAEKERKEKEKAEKKKEKKEKREKRKQAIKEKTKRIFSHWKGFVAGFLAAVITLVGGHFIGAGISKSNKGNKDNNESIVSEDNVNSNTPSDDVVEEEILTNDNFATLTAEFTKKYNDNNLNASTEDLVKFVSIINIDKLVEDNPELAKELFANQSKEEYLGDAAKIIGMTYTYNRNVYESEQSTENFIRISDAVSGSQKEILQMVEGYVDQIALVKNDSEKVNNLIAELIQKLGDSTSELSYLDDGVGFGMQVCIELIRSYLAKDVISQENLDVLSTMTSSEEYVSNIFATYEGCNKSYTKTRTK